MAEKKDLWTIWLEDCNQKQFPITTNNIMFKAFNLFSKLTIKTMRHYNEPLMNSSLKVNITKTNEFNKLFFTFLDIFL